MKKRYWGASEARFADPVAKTVGEFWPTVLPDTALGRELMSLAK